MASSNRNTSTLPQGFSIYQPALGAPLQFLPAVGTAELDELINAYVPGNACSQEKRASVSLDFLEYSHVTGQTFKFYPVYSMGTPVESPVTDSGYGSSFNVSPVASAWDFSQIRSSRSPASQQARSSPKATSSRHQTADFSNLPGMKIMTKDGRDVTNSASRGSKTKEQRDHAHLMRIIKACDSCRRKKIRCDPSHKKRAASQSQSQSTAKSARKSKAVAQAIQVAASASPPVDVSLSASEITIDQPFVSVDLEGFTPSLPALEPWEEFIEYPPVDVPADYDFFYDPEGYFSPESSSSGSALSTKPVTPTSQQDITASYSLPSGENVVASSQLPFNQTESIHNYVDFNLFSPESSFSEDDNMVPIELSRNLSNQSQSPQSNRLQDQSPGGSDLNGGVMGDSSDIASWSLSPRQSGEDEPTVYNIYRDPGAGGGVDQGSLSSSLCSNMSDPSTSMVNDTPFQSIDHIDTLDRIENDVNGAFVSEDIEASHIDCVSTIVNTGQSAPNAPHVGANILSDSVVSIGSTTTQIFARSESSVRIDAYAEHSRNEEVEITDTTVLIRHDAESFAPIAAPDLDSDIGISTTLAEIPAYATSTAQVNLTRTANRDIAIVANTSTSSPLAFVDSSSHSSTELQAPTSNAAVIATHSVTPSEAELSVSRGTETYASVIANTDSFAASSSENTVVDGDELRGETATPDSYDKYRPKKNILSQLLPRQYVSDQVIRIQEQAKCWCAACASTDGRDCVSMSSSMTGTILFLATCLQELFVKQHVVSMAIILLSLLLVISQFVQPSNALCALNGQQAHSTIREVATRTHGINTKGHLWNRFETLKSQTSLGTSSVNRAIQQRMGLITM